MGAEMIGKVGALNKRVANDMVCHPTASIVVMLGVVLERRKLTEPLHDLGIMRSISLDSLSRRCPYLVRQVAVERVPSHGE